MYYVIWRVSDAVDVGLGMWCMSASIVGYLEVEHIYLTRKDIHTSP